VTFEQLIAEQRPHVERVIQDLARRHYLASPEIQELRDTVDRALERNDYELLRAFDGRSTWETYLTTVVTRQFFMFQAALWGHWRPTAAAVRLGPAAMLLEELVLRDRFGLNDAIDWMRTTHRVDLPRHRLLQMAEQLEIAGAASARHRSAPAMEAPAPSPTLQAALHDALALVSPDDRLILELRFRDHQPLTRIAAVLKTDARPLQRRIETAKEVIRRSLITQGIDADDVEALLASADGDVAGSHQHWWDMVLARPSNGSADQ
jgi:RNA polymerase sigma factor for flagellar operon FliA